MSKIIVSLVGKCLGVVEYLKKVYLSIISGYAMSVIPSRAIPISVSMRRLFLYILKWCRIVALFPFTDKRVSTMRSWLDYVRSKCSL